MIFHKLHGNYPITFLLHDLGSYAREKYGTTYDKWVAVGAKLAAARNDPRGHALEHLDANIDLILRCLEDEQKEIISSTGSYMNGGPMFLQLTMSKTWLFSVYEIVRETCEVPCLDGPEKKRYCGDQSCFRCGALKPVKNRLATYRMPLAKLQPQGRGITRRNELPTPAFNNENGSVGWKTTRANGVPEALVSRQELSDFVLDTILKG